MPTTHVVTGAFSYTGSFIARRLLDAGHRVRTLTNHSSPSPDLAARIPAAPLDFGDPDGLARFMRGAGTLYNTYWLHSNYGANAFAQAASESRTLIWAAREAGVQRVVHLSIANPTMSRSPYYRRKAELEEIVRTSGMSYAIIRPTLVYGHGDVLINNIGWVLRRLPLFTIPGDGAYRVQPVHVEDVADLAVRAGLRVDNVTLDAAGPDILRFDELVHLIRLAVGSKAVLVKTPARLALAGAAVAGLLVGDALLTTEQLTDLVAELLVSREPSRGSRHFRGWLSRNGAIIGHRYASARTRHMSRPAPSAVGTA